MHGCVYVPHTLTGSAGIFKILASGHWSGGPQPAGAILRAPAASWWWRCVLFLLSPALRMYACLSCMFVYVSACIHA